MSELSDFVSSVPLVTRIITITSLVIGGLNSLTIVPSSEFICYLPDVLGKFEVYRLLTGFLIPNPQAMQGMMEIYMVYRFSRGIEEGKFNKRLSDYIYYLMIIIPIIVVIGLSGLGSVYSFHPALLSALTFTWSIKNYNQQVNFYFMPIPASLLPSVSLGFRLLVDGIENFKLSLLGLASAYIYNCLETGSFGPLVSFITGKEPVSKDPTSHRLGMYATSNQTQWFYSTGSLSAPEWLQSLFGESKKASAEKSGKVKTWAKAVGVNTAFQGQGRRLGTVKDKSS